MLTFRRPFVGARGDRDRKLLNITLKNKEKFGRGERIRTSGPCLPKIVLYQAELLPDRMWPEGRRKTGRGYIGAGPAERKRRFGCAATRR